MPPPSPEPGPAEPPPAPRGAPASAKRTVLLVLFAAAVYVPQFMGRELLPPDEPRFALVAAESFRRADPVLPTRGGEPYLDKPPLLMWSVAASYWLFGGPHGGGAHLPPLLASLALTALLHRAARRWFDEPVATAAVLVHLSAPLVLSRGAWLSTDPLLTLGVFGCVSSLSREPGRSPWAGSAASAWLAFALLAKGPVAVLHVAIAVLAARFAGFRAMHPQLLVRPRPLAVLLAAVAPWPVLLAWRMGGPAALAESLWTHTAVRFVRPFDNFEPWWFYGGSLAIGLFPWSVALVASLHGGRWRRLAADPRRLWLISWPLLTVLFFSLTAGKRNVYLLPAYPAIAILVAASLPGAGEVRARRVLGAALALASLPLLAAGTLVLLDPAALGLLPDDLPAPAVLRPALAATALALGAGVLGAAVAAARGGRFIVHGPAAAALVIGALCPFLLVPAANGAQGARAFATSVNEHVPPGATLGACRGKSDLVAFYTGRPVRLLETPERVREFLAEDGPAALVCRGERLPARRAWPAGAERVMSGRVGRLALIVLAWNAAAAESGSESRPSAKMRE